MNTTCQKINRENDDDNRQCKFGLETMQYLHAADRTSNQSQSDRPSISDLCQIGCNLASNPYRIRRNVKENLKIPSFDSAVSDPEPALVPVESGDFRLAPARPGMSTSTHYTCRSTRRVSCRATTGSILRPTRRRVRLPLRTDEADRLPPAAEIRPVNASRAVRATRAE